MADVESFIASVARDAPDAAMPPPLAALWWDRKGDWARAHSLVDELETPEAMAVHAYLHRKGGDAGNAAYWDRRSRLNLRRETLAEEWTALAEALLARGECGAG